MLKLGIDAGAFSIQIVVLSEDNKILYKQEKNHQKKVKETTVQMVEEALLKTDSKSIKVCVCGSMSHLLNMPQNAVVSDQASITTALMEFEPNAKSCIALGAQKTILHL